MSDSVPADQINESGDVTDWFRNVEKGDDRAAEQLWEYCYPKMLAYSKRRLPANLRKVLDEEDIVISAFRSLCDRARRGELKSVQGRVELLKLLHCITGRKTVNHIKHESREKRGSGRVRGESWFSSKTSADSDTPSSGIDQVESPLATPEMLAQYAEQCEKMLDQLQDPMLETIALLRLEGYSVDEISERMGCAKRSVERRLNLIRRIWEQHRDNG